MKPSSAELRLREELDNRGIGYMPQARPAPLRRGTADLLFPEIALAVYVDGCFWHGCPRHGRQTGRSGGYWADAALATRVRDAQTDLALRSAGWQSLRFWEHDCPQDAADRIEAALAAASQASARSCKPSQWRKSSDAVGVDTK